MTNQSLNSMNSNKNTRRLAREIARNFFRYIRQKELIFLSVFIFFQVSRPGLAQAKVMPCSLLKWPEKGADYAIVVDKSAQKLFLYHRDDISQPLKEYKCSTGENGGPKSKKNDKKTPEGVYFFTGFLEKRQLAAEYGDRAFPIDYPNPLDRKKGKSGYGIWMHGTNEPLKPRDTKGCIVLENRSINELAPYIKLHITPLIITPGIEQINPEKFEQESGELQETIDHWREAWEEMDISRYMSFYDKSFFARGMDWRRWKAYKTRLAKKYKKVYIDIGNLLLLRTNGIALARFNQTFCSEMFGSKGEKRLYLEKKDNQWKIVGEFFKKDKVYKKNRFCRQKYDLPEINHFLDAWKNAWEKKDLNAYIGFYDGRFNYSGMNLKAWKTYKAKLNKKYKSVKIQLGQIKIIKRSGNGAHVRFRQNYQADTYHDSGIKDMFLVKHGNKWKIKKEKWRPTALRSPL